jgi:hypothetical protein
LSKSSPFSQFSKGIASEFLASVIVVDDRARLTSMPEEEQPTVLNVPGRRGQVPSQTPIANPSGNGAHSLDAKALIDQFAMIGMVCGVLRPSEDDVDNFQTKFSAAMERADVVILDWVLHNSKNGERTLEIIRSLHKSSERGGGRTRLIVIYSGEPDLVKITEDIQKALGVVDQDTPFRVQAGPLHICVYAKEDSTLPPKYNNRKVAPANLSTTVVAEFSEMAGGLISNVALKSLAALRAHTHQLLRKFNSSLDAPYVTHRTLLLPEEASDHIVPLLVAEIQSILEDANVSNVANGTSVSKWLNHRIASGLEIELDGVNKNEVRRGMSYLLNHGIGNDALTSISEKHKKFFDQMLRSKNKAVQEVKKKLTSILLGSEGLSPEADQNLAMLMSIRSRYSTPPPILLLGTIVQETKGKSSQYLLCIQPVCDSIRLKSESPFPFLPLKQSKDGDHCDFIVADRSSAVRLALKDRPAEVRMVVFKPSGKGREIVARKSHTGRFFKASGKTTTTYRWVADLKPEHAQRVANNFAYKLSRVGLTESEWVRRGDDHSN